MCLKMIICKCSVSNKTNIRIFTHFKLWIAVARHNFKRVRIYVFTSALKGFFSSVYDMTILVK